MDGLLPEWFFLMSVGLFGLLFGSLANVIIWRVPRKESIVSPGSHCPSCGTAIHWYDNIPVLSWVLLRARCRSCGGRIAIRYPVVELVSGLLWLLSALLWGMSVRTAFGVAFFYMLLILTFVDLDHYRLPNVLVGVLAGVGAVGVVLSVTGIAPAVPLFAPPSTGVLASPLVYSVVGVVLGAGVSGLIATVYSMARGTAGLGMGDVKFLGTLGIFLGPYVLMVLMIGSILGTVASVILIARGAKASKTRVPFGPFLAVAAVVVCVAGQPLWQWYATLAAL